jgi:hypothetical protein
MVLTSFRAVATRFRAVSRVHSGLDYYINYYINALD